MKISSNRDISFKSVYTNRVIKKGLEFASSNGALFGASATVAFSTLRPFSIMAAPHTDKENKKIAAAKSIASSIINFILMFGLSVPLAKSVKKIDKNPEKYLSPETINKLKDNNKVLTESKGYEFATQLFKLGIAAVAAIPKAIISAAGTPYIAKLFSSKKEKKEEKKNTQKANVSFKGVTESTAGGIGKLINKKGMLKFTDKFKDSNFPMHINALTDLLETGIFMYAAHKNKKIAEDRKNPLIYNAGIATVLSLIGGYTIDKLLQKPTEEFIEKYKKINIADKNLAKQIEGIRIAKPFLILGTIHYLLVPLVSTFLAERADKKIHNL